MIWLTFLTLQSVYHTLCMTSLSLSLIYHIRANQAPQRVTVTHVKSMSLVCHSSVSLACHSHWFVTFFRNKGVTVTTLSHFFKSMGVTVTCHTCDMTVTSLSRLVCHCPCISELMAEGAFTNLARTISIIILEARYASSFTTSIIFAF